MSFPVSKGRMAHLSKGHGNTNFKGFKPQLTSLVDIMVILLIFLIQSFSVEGEIITVSKELMLPKSSAKKKPEVNVIITVNNKAILFEGQYAADVVDVLSNDDLVIENLQRWLKNRRETTEKIAKYSTVTTFKGNVTIIGDKRIKFRLLKKIMYTCGQEGFCNFSLAVEQKE
jgi:biopolymer transport protein ExbD